MDPRNIASNRLLKPFMTYGGTAKESLIGPPFGLIDVGTCDEAYLFRVALPGIRKEECKVKCQVEKDGTVHIRGEVIPLGGEFLRGASGVYQSIVQQLASPGPFMMSFKLPGPVDPRLFFPSFRTDGIFEGVLQRVNVPHARGGSGNPPPPPPASAPAPTPAPAPAPQAESKE